MADMIVEDTTKDQSSVDKLIAATEPIEDAKDDKGNGEDKSADVKMKDESASESETKDEKEGEEAAETEEPEVNVKTDEEARNLRQITRDQKRELERVQNELARVNKILEAAQLESQEDVEARVAAEKAAVERREHLMTLLDMMEVNPKYEDVRDVVSQDHFDDMVEAMAQAYTAKNGGDENEVAKQLTAEIWAIRNPYKYMYDQIKKWHPDYRKADTSAAAGEKKDEGAAAAKGGDKESILKKIPSSLQNMGGGSGKGEPGWTAAKIDKMSEDELDSIPRDIYEKYLIGELK